MNFKKNRNINNLKIDKSWTLFVDRDGVINKRIVDEYVLEWKDFKFINGTFEAFKVFSGVFGKIIVVTNQQGIGKGLMNEAELLVIHSNMVSEIEKNGGRIDEVFFASQKKESNHFDRKPNVGMALKAKKKFPQIDFKKSFMVGDSLSDMKFGHRLGMVNIFVNENKKIINDNPFLINYVVSNLDEFSKLLTV